MFAVHITPSSMCARLSSLGSLGKNRTALSFLGIVYTAFVAGIVLYCDFKRLIVKLCYYGKFSNE